MKNIPPESLLSSVNDLIRTMPTISEFEGNFASTAEWCGRADAIVSAWDSINGVTFSSEVRNLAVGSKAFRPHAHASVLRWLNRVRYDLMLTADPSLVIPVEKGAEFQYFNEVRKVVESAKSDILFVDPYLDADFVSRYLPFVSKSAKVRLLSKKDIEQLVAAAKMFHAEHSTSIEIRKASQFHDRYIFVDGTRCFQSGTSFSAGTRQAPTALTEAIDGFEALNSMYGGIWDSANTQLCT